MNKLFLSIGLALLLFATACVKPHWPGHEAGQPTQAEEDSSTVIVDCAIDKGKTFDIERYNGTSTSSPIPGEASRLWLQGLKTKLTRVWIQLVFVYNNGNINYNYKYTGSNVPVEDALSFYSGTSDSLLVVLSGHKNSGSFRVPVGEAYKDFVRDLVLHYKRKFPRIQYIQVSNEPDAGDETMATYYPVYQNYYRGLNEANSLLQQEYAQNNQLYNPILLSNGGFTSNVPNMLAYAHDFFLSYKNDPDPSKKLDFFTFHSYGESNRPLELLTARQRIDSAMQSHGLPVIPVFLSEYGMVGGSSLPAGMTLAQTVTMQPAGQLTKAFYLYEGGIDKILNWNIHHSSIHYKSELLDPANGIASPYGHALKLCQELTIRKKRVSAISKGIDNVGLGIHAMAASHNNKGIAVLVWNYNWRNTVAEKDINVLIKNIDKPCFYRRKIHCKMYVIDSKNNNYFINPAQTSLVASGELEVDYRPYLKIPVHLERSAVVLLVLTPEKNNQPEI